MNNERITVRQYCENDINEMTEIWNEVVTEGNAFPQEDCLTPADAKDFFASQPYCGVSFNMDNNRLCGLYILHPNNVGRCGHISNASYAVSKSCRGMHIGEKLVLDCIKQAKALNFGILQFNAVVATNIHARHLYERIGFTQLGTIPDGFKMPDGTYEDICPYYIKL